MRTIITIGCMLIYQNVAFSRLVVKTMIKDPINPKYECISNNVKWENNFLVSTTRKHGTISCENTGYRAYIFGKDKLSERERKSIESFLKFAKRHLEIETKFDFFEISIIDNLWLLKNIYERRNLTPKQHNKILGIIKEWAQLLVEESIVEQKELEFYCIGKDDEDKWCHSLIMKNKVWEEYHKLEVENSNKEDKIRRHQEKIKQRQREENEPQHNCYSYDLAKQISIQVIKNKLKDKITYERVADDDFEGSSSEGEQLYGFTYRKTGAFKPTDFKSWFVKINKDTCKTTVSPSRY